MNKQLRGSIRWNNAPWYRRITVLLVLLLVALSACQAAQKSPAFFNPLNALNGADPWLQFYEGNYYLTATQWNSIRMWKSPTLAGLATAEPVTIWTDTTPTRCCNVWAPEFHLLEGPNGPRWYVYYSAGTDATLDNQRMHVLESSGTDPLGPYTYKAQIGDPTNNGWAIDGSVLKMPDQKLYYLFSSWVGPDQSLFIAPMSNPWTISGARVKISQPTLPWEKSLANVNEGPVALQRNGDTFIIYSASACWSPDYKLGMLKYNGGDVLNPDSWVKKPEPVFQRSDANGVYAPGHNGFFTSPDGAENWIVYHANASATDGCTGERTTRVQKFTWNADGTPNFGTPVALDTPIEAPSGERAAAPPAAKTVRYTIVSKNNGQCLDGSGSGNAVPAQMSACANSKSRQWSLDYLANGFYRLINDSTGKALEVAGGQAGTNDGAAIQQAAWTHGVNQQWRIQQATDGWIRFEARHSSKVIDSGSCAATGTPIRQITRQDNNACQEFRLQPVGPVAIIGANSVKAVAVAQASNEDGANVVQINDATSPNARWKFVHQADGYYQIMAEQSGKCLNVDDSTTAPGANINQLSCTDSRNQQWRVDPLNDGMVRLVARNNGQALDTTNCLMADGVKLRQWLWIDNMCQRFYLAP